MYKHGHGVGKDLGMAIRYFKKAAAMDHGPAHFQLAEIFYWDSKRRDYDQAVDSYLKAGDSLVKDPEHQEMFFECVFSLAVLAYQGLGTKKDAMKAAEGYRYAAEAGHAGAQRCLGLCYRDGEGVRRNRRWARHWLAKAAEAGDKEAQRELKKLS